MIGALVMVLGLAGALAAISMIVTVMGQKPSSDHTFAAGQSTTVHFDAGERRVIFLDTRAARHYINCNVSSREVSGGIELLQYGGSLHLNQWESVFAVTVEEAGNYTVSCTGGPADTFGVGGDASVGALFRAMLGVVAGGGVMLLGAAAVIATTVLRRRRTFPGVA